MAKRQKETKEIVRLYEEEKLSLREISERVGITARAVHYRLARTGIIFRSKSRPCRTIERAVLLRLYVDKGLPVYKVAQRLRAAQETVVKELSRHRIKQRPRRTKSRRYPELDSLRIGESVELSDVRLKNPRVSYYAAASVRGIRVSVRSVDPGVLRITRKA